MAEQLTFDLPVRPALGREDYFVSEANQLAVQSISDWQVWEGRKIVLCGPTASGKTHLATVWAADADARIISASDLSDDLISDIVENVPRVAVEDVERIASDKKREALLFHLHNRILAGGGYLMLTGTGVPATWPISLPDLKSRIMGTGLVQLGAPDDALLAAVLVKLFTDRQLDVSPGLISYLAPRMERSFAFAGEVVAGIDALALSEKGALSTDVARRVLDRLLQKGA